MQRRSRGEGSWFVQPPNGRRTYERKGIRTMVDGRTVTTVARKGESRATVKRRHDEKLEELRGAPRSSGETVAGWLETWLALYCKRVAPRTADYYRDIVDRYLVPALGSRPLAKLDADELAVALDRMPGSYSLKAYQVMRIALGRAVKTRRLRWNVCTEIDPPRYRPRVVQPPTAEQVRAIVDAVRGHRDEALVLVALSTGLRAGELCGLRWMDWEVGDVQGSRSMVDVDGTAAGVVGVRMAPSRGGDSVPPAMGLDRGGLAPRHGDVLRRGASLHVRGQLDRSRQYVGAKRGSERVVALPEVAVRALAAHRQRIGLSRGRLPEVGDDRGRVVAASSDGGRADGGDGAAVVHGVRRGVALRDETSGTKGRDRDYIFTTDDGRPLTGFLVRDRWQRVLRAAGVPALSLHSARHAYATFLRLAGMDREHVAKALGHRNVRTTEGYSHGEDELSARAAEIMGRALGS